MKHHILTKYLFPLPGAAALCLLGTIAPAPAQHAGHDKHGENPKKQADEHKDEGGHEGHKEEGEGGHQDEIHFTPTQLKSLDIRVAKLEAGSAGALLERPATLQFDKDRIAKVGPRVEAKVVRVLKDLGQSVAKGEALAIMDSVELGKAKAEYLRLNARLITEDASYQREKSLRAKKVSSEAEVLEAQARFREARAETNAAAETLRLYGTSRKAVENIGPQPGQRLSTFQLVSPLKGVVQQRALSPGQTVGPTETPIHVVDSSEMWLMINAYEQDIPHLKAGQKVSISLRGMPDMNFQGSIDWLSGALAEGSRTLPVRAVVANPDGLLRSGMFATASISTGKDAQTALVPVGAIQEFEGKQVVFVPGDEEGSFIPAPIKIGAEGAGMMEIASGLQPGDRAVVSGAFDIMSALTAKTRSAAHNH